jgi:hypothetical protein
MGQFFGDPAQASVLVQFEVETDSGFGDGTFSRSSPYLN